MSQQYLAHHGIKGQKWGVRRFQEEDGSLTAEGKERYNRGKEYSKERDKIADQKRKEILDKDAEYQKAQKDSRDADWEYDRAKDAYERESAQFHRGQADANIQRRWDKASEKAMKHANEVIAKKYGDTALSDIEHYKAESTKKFERFVGGAFAAMAVAAIGAQVVLKKKGRTL